MTLLILKASLLCTLGRADYCVNGWCGGHPGPTSLLQTSQHVNARGSAPRNMQHPMMGGMPQPMMGGMPNHMMGGMPNPMMGGMPGNPMMGGMPMPGMQHPMMGGMPPGRMPGFAPPLPQHRQIPPQSLLGLGAERKPYVPTDAAAAVAAAHGQPIPQNSAGTVDSKVKSDSVQGHGWSIQEVTSERKAKGTVGNPGPPAMSATAAASHAQTKPASGKEATAGHGVQPKMAPQAQAGPQGQMAPQAQAGPQGAPPMMPPVNMAAMMPPLPMKPAGGVILGAAGYAAPSVNVFPAQNAWPGPVMAPPPLPQAEPVLDPNNKVALAEKDAQWAKSVSISALMYKAQAYQAVGLAARDQAWANVEVILANQDLEKAKKFGAPPMMLAQAQQRVDAALKDLDWSSAQKNAAQMVQGKSMMASAIGMRDGNWANIELRTAKKQIHQMHSIEQEADEARELKAEDEAKDAVLEHQKIENQIQNQGQDHAGI